MSEPDYVPTSNLAIISGLTGVASVSGLLVPELASFAVPAVVCGIAAHYRIRKYGRSGRRLAGFGMVCSATFAMLTPVWHFLQYQAEALSDHARVSFMSSKSPDQDGRLLDQWVGQKVCLKGYAVSPEKFMSLQQFSMTPRGGGNLHRANTVLVELPPGGEWTWDSAPIAVSGTLERSSKGFLDVKVPRYVLRLSVVRNSRTRFGLVPQAPGGGC